MAQIGLIFGSDEGNTEAVAYRIQNRFGDDVVDVLDVADVTQVEIGQYDKLIFGIPTWDFGQIQSDWEEFWGDISAVSFTGKAVALFGLGDQFGYGDFFLDAMGMLHDVIVERGASIVGHWPTEGYEFDASKAQVANQDAFVGLGIDEDQQPELTKERLNKWCGQVHREFQLATPLHSIED